MAEYLSPEPPVTSVVWNAINDGPRHALSIPATPCPSPLVRPHRPPTALLAAHLGLGTDRVKGPLEQISSGVPYFTEPHSKKPGLERAGYRPRLHRKEVQVSYDPIPKPSLHLRRPSWAPTHQRPPLLADNQDLHEISVSSTQAAAGGAMTSSSATAKAPDGTSESLPTQSDLVQSSKAITHQKNASPVPAQDCSISDSSPTRSDLVHSSETITRQRNESPVPVSRNPAQFEDYMQWLGDDDLLAISLPDLSHGTDSIRAGLVETRTTDLGEDVDEEMESLMLMALEQTERAISNATSSSLPRAVDAVGGPYTGLLRGRSRNFPLPAQANSPVPGLTMEPLLRVCFTIRQALQVGDEAKRRGLDIIMEVYGLVTSSERYTTTGCQTFEMAERNPSGDQAATLRSRFMHWRWSRLSDVDSRAFLRATANEPVTCRCVGWLVGEGQQRVLHLLNIWQADLDDIQDVAERVVF